MDSDESLLDFATENIASLKEAAEIVYDIMSLLPLCVEIVFNLCRAEAIEKNPSQKFIANIETNVQTFISASTVLLDELEKVNQELDYFGGCRIDLNYWDCITYNYLSYSS